MTRLQPAPDAILHLAKCGCAKQKCSTNRCQCRKAGLKCTDLCSCNEDELCDNVADSDEDNNGESGEEDDDINDDNDDGENDKEGDSHCV